MAQLIEDAPLIVDMSLMGLDCRNDMKLCTKGVLRPSWGPVNLRPLTSHSGHLALVLKFHPSWAAHATQTIPWIIVICSLKSWCSFSNMLLKKLMKLMFLPSDFLVFFLQVSNINAGSSRRQIAMAVGPYQLRQETVCWCCFCLVWCLFFGELQDLLLLAGALVFVFIGEGLGLENPVVLKIHEVQRILERIGELNRAELLQKAEALGFTRKQAQALWETFEAWMVCWSCLEAYLRIDCRGSCFFWLYWRYI